MIGAAFVDGLVISQNVISGYSGLTPLSAQHSTNVVVAGNSVDVDGPATLFASASCLFLGDITNGVVSANTCNNPETSGIRLYYDTYPGSQPNTNVIVTGNAITDTRSPAVLGTGITVDSPCTGCTVSGNNISVATGTAPTVGWYSIPTGVTAVGNSGYVGSTLTYLPTFTGGTFTGGTFTGTKVVVTDASAFALKCDGGTYAGVTCTVDGECPSSKCSADAYTPNDVVYGGDGINSEGSAAIGSGASGENGVSGTQKNGHIVFPNWATVTRTIAFPDSSGTVVVNGGSAAAGIAAWAAAGTTCAAACTGQGQASCGNSIPMDGTNTATGNCTSTTSVRMCECY
jgi:hypothetical protein